MCVRFRMAALHPASHVRCVFKAACFFYSWSHDKKKKRNKYWHHAVQINTITNFKRCFGKLNYFRWWLVIWKFPTQGQGGQDTVLYFLTVLEVFGHEDLSLALAILLMLLNCIMIKMVEKKKLKSVPAEPATSALDERCGSRLSADEFHDNLMMTIRITAGREREKKKRASSHSEY